MYLIINNHRKISEIQKEFSEAFPFLKIEFFSKPHGYKAGNERRDLIKTDSTLKQIRNKNAEGKVSLLESRTVMDFEFELRETYGLNAQVFRKSGNVWIETSLTDEWTLGIQNKEGLELSQPLSKKKYPDEATGMEQE